MHPRSGAALLFDIDGTLADTDPLHLEAFNRTFGPYGHHFDKAQFALELQGKANAAIAARFVPDLPPEQQHAVMAGKETISASLPAPKPMPWRGCLPCSTLPMPAACPWRQLPTHRVPMPI